MLALIAGQGRLPVILAQRLAADGVNFQVYEMDGYPFENPNWLTVVHFRIENLGSLLDGMVARGITQVCFAGAIGRPRIDPAMIDAATAPLLTTIKSAIAAGDDGALRAIISLFSDRGIAVRAASEIAPGLIPAAGRLTAAGPSEQQLVDAGLGWAVLDQQGAVDIGQACVIGASGVLAREVQSGTAAMLAMVTGASGGFLFKGAKPGQDPRVDQPTIGTDTVADVRRAGLAGIIIQAGTVLVLDLGDVVHLCDQAGLFLYSVERG